MPREKLKKSETIGDLFEKWMGQQPDILVVERHTYNDSSNNIWSNAFALKLILATKSNEEKKNFQFRWICEPTAQAPPQSKQTKKKRLDPALTWFLYRI